MHLLPLMIVMLDIICMGSVDLRGARYKQKNQNEKFLPTLGFNLEMHSQILYLLSELSGIDENSALKVTLIQRPIYSSLTVTHTIWLSVLSCFAC